MTRSAEISAYFARYRHELIVHVRVHAVVDDQLLEDACSYAWAQLVRRPDLDLTAIGGFFWLKQCAIHEAWRLHTLAARAELIDPADLPAVAGENPDLEERLDLHVDAREKLELLGELTPRQRRLLALQAAGHSYHEIEQITGCSYATINRQLVRGRARLQKLA